MLPYVSMILFAIHGAIKVGQKLRVIYEDNVRDEDLVLPPVGVVPPDLPDWDLDVKPFFEKEGQALVAPPPHGELTKDGQPALPEGMYYPLWKEKGKPANQTRLCLAYQNITNNLAPHRQDEDVNGDYRREPDKFYQGTNALFVVKQWREGTDPKRPVWQRLAGTVVELAVDYATARPGLFGGNGRGDRLVRSFLLSVQDVDFDARHDELLREILQASLNTFAGQADMVVGDDTLALLLRRVATTLVNRVEEAENDASQLLTLYNFRRDMLQDVLRISAATVSEKAGILLGSPDSKEEQLLNVVLQSVLNAFQEQPQLFSNQTLRSMYSAGLTAAAQNAGLILPGQTGEPSHEFLTQLFTGTVQLLDKAGQSGPRPLFNLDLARDVTTLALDILSQNARQLIKPKDPQRQFLVQALEGMLLGFSGKLHNNQNLPQILAETFSQKQLVAMVREVFVAVARNPAALLDGDPQRSALAQIIGSVAAVVSLDNNSLLTGDGYVELLQVALEAFALNPDRLLNLNTTAPLDNIMAQVMTAVLKAANENLKKKDRRHLLWGDVLLQAMEAALAAVSKNTEGFLAHPEIVTAVLERLLKAASNGQANVLDAENLLVVFSPLLSRALQEGEGILSEDDKKIITKYLADVS
jgi:hypothetical protein